MRFDSSKEVEKFTIDAMSHSPPAEVELADVTLTPAAEVEQPAADASTAPQAAFPQPSSSDAHSPPPVAEAEVVDQAALRYQFPYNYPPEARIAEDSGPGIVVGVPIELGDVSARQGAGDIGVMVWPPPNMAAKGSIPRFGFFSLSSSCFSPSSPFMS